jgi:tryptophan synthase beta chain
MTAYFGRFGGCFVPEVLAPPLRELEGAFEAVKKDTGFHDRLNRLLRDYAGRPTPLYPADRLSREAGARVYLKREDLLHGGAHKTNNALGQALLAQRMGKKRLIAETGAGQHGCAVAMAGAMLGFEVEIYMGARDMERQRPNVERMRFCGARVIPVSAGQATLKEAINSALRDWTERFRDTHYLLGSVTGPAPYPRLVRFFQEVIGREARDQIVEQTGRLPDRVYACVGGGSNAIGIFSAFIQDKAVQLVGVEAGGTGEGPGEHSATLTRGAPGILHGSLSYLLQDEEGEVLPAHSIAPGLDYPGVGPEHSELKESGRARYRTVSDREALAAFRMLARLEGILPALESSHALAAVLAEREEMRPEEVVVVNLSGRGDKDLETVMRNNGDSIHFPACKG